MQTTLPAFNSVRIFFLTLTLLIALPSSANNAQSESEQERNTVDESYIPAKAPRFEDYPAALYQGPHAKLRLGKDDAFFKTRLHLAAQQEINFAGHYIVGLWGCGYSCLILRIIDTQTGKILPTQGLGSIAFNQVADSMLDASPHWPNEGPAKFRADSKLLVLLGAPEEDQRRQGINYYVLENGNFKLLRHIKFPKVIAPLQRP